ncbi:MAG: tetratricopeptide repeat protein [Planctomycetota bacterium]
MLAKTLILMTCLVFATRSAALADIVVTSSLKAGSEPWVRASKLVDARDLTGARREIKNALGSDPDKPHLELVLADLCFQKGNAALGLSILEEVSAVEGERFDIRFAFCVLAMKQGRWFDCWTHIQLCEKAPMPESWSEKRHDQVRFELMGIKASCCEARKDWTQAVELFRELAESAKKRNDSTIRRNALFGSARALFHLQQLKQCRDMFGQLKEEDSTSNPAELAIAKLYDAEGKLDEAELWFRKALKSSPDETKLPFARWLIWNNRPESVATILQDFVPPVGQGEAKYIRVLALRMQGDLDAAQDALQELLKNQPGANAVSNQLALVLIERKSDTLRQRALQIAKTIAERDPQNPESWSTLGWIQLELGKIESAKINLAKAAAGGRLSRDAAFFQGELHRALGDKEKATSFYELAKNAKGPFFYFDRLPQ